MAFKKWTKSAEQLEPDPIYGSLLAAKFVNCMMWSGKKSVTQKIFYNALKRVGEKVKDTPPIKVFEQAIDNVRPNIQIRSKRVGGSNYQVPMPVNSRRSQTLAIRWIIDGARSKKGQAMESKLASELIDAYNRQGAAFTARENVHKMADANKAFAHFAW